MTDRDTHILIPLVRSVRGFTVEQVASAFWNGRASGRRDARRRLRTLEAMGLVRLRTLVVRLGVVSPEDGPLFSWRPGDAPPDGESLSYRACKRLAVSPPRSVSVVTATERAARRFGGVARGFVRPFQAGHDLGLAEVYLHLLRTAPATARRFVSEDMRPKARKGERVFDASIEDDEGRVTLLVEVAGTYPAVEFTRLHAEAVRRGIPYIVF